MRFYTAAECESWLSGHNRKTPRVDGSPPALRLNYPDKPYRIIGWTHWIATSLPTGGDCLLWITHWGIFSSTENLHLYYRLRQPYQDFRLLHEAPGHLFLKHEAEDLASFLQIAMLNAWDVFILTHFDYANAFFSHEEFIDFYSSDASLIDNIRSNLAPERNDLA